MRINYPEYLAIPGGSRRQSCILAPLLAASLITCAPAQAEDWLSTVKSLNPYVAAGYTYDSNLFRLESQDEAKEQIGTSSRDERYTTLEAGFNTDIAVSRQRFLINGRVHHNKYNDFDKLDYNGGDAGALWEWTRGSLWDGDLGYSYRRTLRSFANQTVPQKDIRTENKILGSANRWLTDRWRAGVHGDWSDIDFSDANNLDRQRQLGGVSIDYVAITGNSVGFETEYANADYDNSSQNDYDEVYAGPTAFWKVTGKTTLLAKAGYTSRNFDDSTRQKDYDGFTGRVTMNWKAHKDSGVKAAVYREISNLDDEIADYAEIHGIRVEPTWQILNKTVLRGLAEYEDRNFKGDRENPGNLDQREDDVYTAGLWIDWNPYRKVDLSVGYDYEKRDSNRDGEEYSSQAVRARVSVGL